MLHEILTFGSSFVGDASPCDWESADPFCRVFGVFLTLLTRSYMYI